MPLPNAKIYTTEDIYALPEGERAELIDGRLYNMAPPSRIHQEIFNGIVCHIKRLYPKERW